MFADYAELARPLARAIIGPSHCVGGKQARCSRKMIASLIRKLFSHLSEGTGWGRGEGRGYV